MLKIAVAGAGPVGLSLAVLLARQHEVLVLDSDAARVALLNARRPPVAEPGLEGALADPRLRLRATLDPQDAYHGADFVVVAVPTDGDPLTGQIRTDQVEAVVRQVLAIQPDAVLVIRSTVPVGFTHQLKSATGARQLLCAPEFLREGHALHDILHPARIVVGDRSAAGQAFADLLRQCALDPDVPVLLTGSTEAEAIKLFANAHLALRVAWFNELDSFAVQRGLDARQIIEGVCLDPRVGARYNNPSFGYGGACLPKDTRQLLADGQQLPQDLLRATVAANASRKAFIADAIARRQPKVVGIYRLAMKAGSASLRDAAVLDVVALLQARGLTVIVHEPLLPDAAWQGCRLVHDVAAFKTEADVIVANRLTDELRDVQPKVVSRDLFGGDG